MMGGFGQFSLAYWVLAGIKAAGHVELGRVPRQVRALG